MPKQTNPHLVEMHRSVEIEYRHSSCIPSGMQPYGLQGMGFCIAFLPSDAILTDCGFAHAGNIYDNLINKLNEYPYECL